MRLLHNSLARKHGRRFGVVSVAALALALNILASQSEGGAERFYGAGSRQFPEIARPSDEFVDTIGTNVHLEYRNSPYRDNFAMVRSRLIELRIRHIRNGLFDSSAWPEYYERLEDLAQNGIRGLFVTRPGQSASLLTSFPKRVPHSFEAYEGPNEYDLSQDPDWVNTLRSFQSFLYHTVKDEPSTALFMVVGPALTTEKARRSLGAVSSDFDVGNLHNYFAGRNPGTPGWGPNGYGSIEWHLDLVRQTSVMSKPVISTETGYDTAPAVQDGIPEIVFGRYMPRVFLEQFMRGVRRTYSYELLDEGRNDHDPEQNFGLLRYDGSPKPAYLALANLIRILEDPGPAFTPHPVHFAVTGNTANIARPTEPVKNRHGNG